MADKPTRVRRLVNVAKRTRARRADSPADAGYSLRASLADHLQGPQLPAYKAKLREFEKDMRRCRLRDLSLYSDLHQDTNERFLRRVEALPPDERQLIDALSRITYRVSIGEQIPRRLRAGLLALAHGPLTKGGRPSKVNPDWHETICFHVYELNRCFPDKAPLTRRGAFKIIGDLWGLAPSTIEIKYWRSQKNKYRNTTKR